MVLQKPNSEKIKMKKITVVIPCYNEETGLSKVIKDIPKEKLKELGYDVEVLVVDNNSSDNTHMVAVNNGTRVIFEGKQGKRYAFDLGFKEAEGDYIVTIDGDNTYPPREIVKLVEKINGNDLVIGTRFDSIWNLKKLFVPRELPFSRVIANKVGALLGTIILTKKITDVTTGLRLFKKDIFERIPVIKAKNLDFEAEFTARVISNKLKYVEVKTETNFREGNSSLQYFRDAFRFLWAMIRGRFF